MGVLYVHCFSHSDKWRWIIKAYCYVKMYASNDHKYSGLLSWNRLHADNECLSLSYVHCTYRLNKIRKTFLYIKMTFISLLHCHSETLKGLTIIPFQCGELVCTWLSWHCRRWTYNIQNRHTIVIIIKETWMSFDLLLIAVIW